MEEKYCKHIDGIKCNVENCYYHENACDCTAHEVSVGSVGPHCADCSGDTLCATFRPKEEA